MRPITKEIKEMQGTLEPSKEIEPETVQFEQVQKFFPPDDWPEEAKIIFLDICKIVRSGGYLTRATYIGIRAFSFHEHLRRRSEEILKDDPTDTKWGKVLDLNSKAVERWCAKFGLTPADLYRVPAVKKDDTKTLSLLK